MSGPVATPPGQHEPHQLLGRLLVAAEAITEPELRNALAFQSENTFMHIGEILLGQGRITFEQLIETLHQQHQMLKLGQILVRGGHVTHAQLEQALGRQTTTGERLGAAIVSLGYCPRERIDQALAYQKWYDGFKAHKRHRDLAVNPPAHDHVVHHRWSAASGMDHG